MWWECSCSSFLGWAELFHLLKNKQPPIVILPLVVAAVVDAECMQGDNFPRTRRTTIDTRQIVRIIARFDDDDDDGLGSTQGATISQKNSRRLKPQTVSLRSPARYVASLGFLMKPHWLHSILVKVGSSNSKCYQLVALAKKSSDGATCVIS